MKYLLIILVSVFLIAGCSYNKRLAKLERMADFAERDMRSTDKRIMWLLHRDEIKKIKPPYPKDIKLINSYFNKIYLEEYNIKSLEGIQLDYGLIPTPVAISKKHGRLYMIFRVGKGDGEFLQVHKQNVIKHSEFDEKIWDIREDLDFVLTLIISELE